MKTKLLPYSRVRFWMWVLLLSLGLQAEELQKLRQNQKADQDRLLEYYDNKALKECPTLADGKINKASPEYKKLLNDYKRAHKKLNEAYRKKDPRLTDLKAESPGLKNSGSVPKNVNSDVDWTAETDEAYQKKKQEWEARDDKVEVEEHKVVNKTTDETMWEPGTKAGDNAVVRDGDAHGTEGGRQKVAGGDNVRDAEGSALDQKKKYLDAKKRGNMKDQAKVVTKGADDTGRSNDTIEEARKRKEYGDTVTSETSDLGDSKETRQQKEKEFGKRLDQEVEKNIEEATKKGQKTDEIREKIQDQAKKTDTTKDAEWDKARKDANYDGQKTTDEAIKERRDRVKESNQKTREEIARREQELEKSAAETEGKSADTAEADKPKVEDADAKRIQEGESKTESSKVKTEDAPVKKAAGPETDVAKSKTNAPDVPKTEVDAPKADAPKVEVDAPKGKMSKLGDAAGTADDVIDFIDRGTQMAEGIAEGDNEKTIAPVVGQDTAKRVQMENAKEWADEEGKVEEARGDEVSTKLEAKLRRKGASKDEADEARGKFEKGDMKGFRDDVAKIKEKGIEDTKKDGFTPDGALEEEDGAVERLKEGGKQTIDYVDPGVRARSKESKENLEGLDKQNDDLQKNLQDEIDQEIIKKAMRKGIDRKEAEAALEKKRKGDNSDWKKLRDGLERNNKNEDGSGLSAEDRTQKYEFGNQVEEKGKDAADFAEEKGKIVLKPVKKILEAQDKAHLDEMSKDEQAAEAYKKLRKLGVPPEEAMDAARDFAEDETAAKMKIRELRDKYRKIQEEEAQAKKEAEREAKEQKLAKEKEEKRQKQALKESEATDQEEWSEEKDLENKHKALEEFAQKNREQRQKETDQDYEGMEVQSEMTEAEHAGDDDRRQARTERNQAGEEARDTEFESNRIVAEGDKENSWGKAIGDAVEDGFTTGARTMGQEFGNAAAEKAIDNIWEPEKPQPPPRRPSGGAAASSSGNGGGSPTSSGMVSSGGQTEGTSSPEGATIAGTEVGDPDAIGNEPGLVGPDAIENEPGTVDPDAIENEPGLAAETPASDPICPYCKRPLSIWRVPYTSCPDINCRMRAKEEQLQKEKQAAPEKAAVATPTPKPIPRKPRGDDGYACPVCGKTGLYSSWGVDNSDGSTVMSRDMCRDCAIKRHPERFR